MPSILKPDGSIVIGIATGILVAGIYKQGLPDVATMHATDASDPNIESGRKKATIASAVVLSGITLLTKDVNVFILGAVVLFALDLQARHANASHPETGQLVSPAPGYEQLRSVS
jgi:hypothetical protein